MSVMRNESCMKAACLAMYDWKEIGRKRTLVLLNLLDYLDYLDYFSAEIPVLQSKFYRNWLDL